MMLFRALRLPESATGEEADDLLLEGAVLFLRAGGVVTLSDFAALGPRERAALVMARRLVQAEERTLDAAAHGTEEERIRGIAHLDGGQGMREFLVRRTARGLADQMSAEAARAREERESRRAVVGGGL